MTYSFIYLSFKPEPFAPWLAPYLLAFVVLGILLYVFRIFESWYVKRHNKPLYKHLWVYKKLTQNQLGLLKNEFPFYQNLSKKQQRQFQHRLSNFLSKKEFLGREGFGITEHIKVLIGAQACMLSFGRKNYSYKLIDYIIVFPDVFSSGLSESRKVEFNPKEKALALSWNHFVAGQKLNLPEKRNLLVFQFMQALHLEARVNNDNDSNRLENQFQNILRHLTEPGVKEELESGILKYHPFSNEFEFLGVLAEIFFEAPKVFQLESPMLFEHVKHLLGFDFEHYRVSET